MKKNLSNMKNATRKVILILLLLNIFLGDCGTTPIDKPSAANDDDDYDYGGDGDFPDPTLTSKAVSFDPPFFEKSDVEKHVTVGESALLECDIRNFRSDYNTILWYKGDQIVVVGHDPLNKRLEAASNNAIRIKKVESEDVGDYYCEVLPEKIRQHTVVKLGGLKIFCNSLDLTNSTMNTKEGSPIHCECKSYSSEDAEIKWSINGVRAENIASKVDKGQLYIDNIGADHEGIYQCLADDKTSRPAISALIINVNYQPRVSTHRHHINTQKGEMAELYCDYKANPIGTIRWRKDGKEINFSPKYHIKHTLHHHRNRTLLEIKDVTDRDLGEYTCHVKNTVGAGEAKVFLQYEPETPQFEDIEIKGNLVRLHWLVRSLQPLSEAILNFKMSGTFEWSTVSVLHTERHADEGGMWKITHEMELVPGKWHAQIRTKNTVGWSKFSEQHDFEIKDTDEADDNNVNVELPPQDMVMAAGVGLNKNNGNSAAIATRSPFSFKFVLSTLFLWMLFAN